MDFSLGLPIFSLAFSRVLELTLLDRLQLRNRKYPNSSNVSDPERIIRPSMRADALSLATLSMKMSSFRIRSCGGDSRFQVLASGQYRTNSAFRRRTWRWMQEIIFVLGSHDASSIPLGLLELYGWAVLAASFGFQRSTGLRAAAASSSRPMRVECGACNTSSGFSTASRAIDRIASMNWSNS